MKRFAERSLNAVPLLRARELLPETMSMGYVLQQCGGTECAYSPGNSFQTRSIYMGWKEVIRSLIVQSAEMEQNVNSFSNCA